MMNLSRVFQALALLSISALIGAQTQIQGSGASTLSPLFGNLVFSFRSVNPDVQVSYASTGSGAGRAAVMAPNQKNGDFAGSNTIFSKADVATAAANKRTLLSLVSSVSAIVLAYNLPNVSTQLIIDRSSIAAIFKANLTMWNDPRLQTLNPTVTLPNRKINLVYRSDKSGTTNTLMQALRKFDPKFPLAAVDAPTPSVVGNNSALWWPFLVDTSAPACPSYVDLKSGNFPEGYSCKGNGNSEGAAQVQFHPYSIGYMGVSFLPSGQTYFHIKNKRGFVVKASSASVQSALSFGVAAGSANLPSVASETSPTGNMDATLDADVDDAWPITEFDFYMIPDNLNADCSKALQIAQFLIWSIESQTAQDAMTFLGYVPLPSSLATIVIDRITKVKCGDPASATLAYDSLYPDESALLIVSYLCCGILCFCGLLLIWKFNHPSVTAGGAKVLIFQAFGAAANCLNVILYTGYPTQLICDLRPWLHILELVIVYGVFILQTEKYLQRRSRVARVKQAGDVTKKDDHDEVAHAVTVEVNKVAENAAADAQEAVENEDPDVVRSNTKKLILICLGVIILWLILAVAWVASEPPTELRRKCVGSLQNTFKVLMIAFNIALIITSAVLAYKNDDLHAVIHPIFVMILINALFQPMAFIIGSAQFPDRRPIALILSPSVGILLGTMLEAALLILPTLSYALLHSAEEIAAKHALEADVKEYHKEIELVRQASRKSITSGGSESEVPQARLQRLRSRVMSNIESKSDQGQAAAPAAAVSVTEQMAKVVADDDIGEHAVVSNIESKSDQGQAAAPAAAVSVTAVVVADDDIGEQAVMTPRTLVRKQSLSERRMAAMSASKAKPIDRFD